MTLARVIEFSQELNQRGVAPQTMAATVATLGIEYRDLDNDLRQVMATQSRPQTFRPFSNDGTNGLPEERLAWLCDGFGTGCLFWLQATIQIGLQEIEFPHSTMGSVSSPTVNI